MRRKIIMCLCLIFLLLLNVGCTQKASKVETIAQSEEYTQEDKSKLSEISEENEEDGDMKSEEVPEVDYDYINSRKVLKKALDSNWRVAEYILEVINIPKIKGVISAKIVPEDTPESLDVTLDIESEDNIKYRIYMSRSYRVFGIEDLDASEVIYFSD